MFIARILAPALLAFGLLTAATPTKRDDAQVLAIFTTLKAKTDVILPQFGELVGNHTATDATVGPLISQLKVAMRQAVTSMVLLPFEKRRLASRQTNQDVANLVGGIVSDIALGLVPLQSAASTIPALDLFLIDIDNSLQEILLGLSVIVDGILTLIQAVVDYIASVLDSLGFGLVVSTLGL